MRLPWFLRTVCGLGILLTLAPSPARATDCKQAVPYVQLGDVCVVSIGDAAEGGRYPDQQRVKFEQLEEGKLVEKASFTLDGLSGKPTPYPHWPAALKGLSLRGWVASSIWASPERFSRNRDLILQGLASGHLKPIIAKTFPFSQIVDAHRYLESNQQVGKVVVTV